MADYGSHTEVDAELANFADKLSYFLQRSENMEKGNLSVSSVEILVRSWQQIADMQGVSGRLKIVGNGTSGKAD